MVKYIKYMLKMEIYKASIRYNLEKIFTVNLAKCSLNKEYNDYRDGSLHNRKGKRKFHSISH